MMLIDEKFEIGETVYLKTDSEQHPRLVTGISIRIGSLTYGLSCGSQESYHYDFEISEKVNILMTINN